jgi:tetratricopeptide (TPR) repeat protein
MKTAFRIICISIVLLSSCKSGRERAIAYVKDGQEMEARQRSKAAYELFTKAINTDPTFAPAWFYRGNNKFNHKDLEGAIADYSRAVELNPDFADAWSNRGDAYFSQGHKEKACPDYLRAEQLGKPNMYEKTRRCK